MSVIEHIGSGSSSSCFSFFRNKKAKIRVTTINVKLSRMLKL